MALQLPRDLDARVQAAVRHFWDTRSIQSSKQQQGGRADHGARMFAWDSTANWVASANIGEGAVVSLRRDPSNGKLTQTGQVLEVPQPSFVVFAKPQQGGGK